MYPFLLKIVYFRSAKRSPTWRLIDPGSPVSMLVSMVVPLSISLGSLLGSAASRVSNLLPASLRLLDKDFWPQFLSTCYEKDMSKFCEEGNISKSIEIFLYKLCYISDPDILCPVDIIICEH